MAMQTFTLPTPNRRGFLVAAGCAMAMMAMPAFARPRASKLLLDVPPAYHNAALRAGVPPRLLYGIALQESKMLFGERVLPWLWTLNVAGRPHRYETYGDGVRALTHWVRTRGIRNVDCGPMQVNWRWHGDKLQSFEKALDAHYNLAVGASILATHYRDSGDWVVAAGRYHHPTDTTRAANYAKAVFRRIPMLREVA